MLKNALVSLTPICAAASLISVLLLSGCKPAADSAAAPAIPMGAGTTHSGVPAGAPGKPALSSSPQDAANNPQVPASVREKIRTEHPNQGGASSGGGYRPNYGQQYRR